MLPLMALESLLFNNLFVNWHWHTLHSLDYISDNHYLAWNKGNDCEYSISIIWWCQQIVLVWEPNTSYTIYIEHFLFEKWNGKNFHLLWWWNPYHQNMQSVLVTQHGGRDIVNRAIRIVGSLLPLCIEKWRWNLEQRKAELREKEKKLFWSDATKIIRTFGETSTFVGTACLVN